MIFVTLGTQDKSFKRLLDAIQKQIDNGHLSDKIIVQAGYTKYESDDMEIHKLLDRETFADYMSQCDLLITHGGVGSIINGLNHGKKIIAASRLSEYGEHTNNHQVQIVDNFSKNGYILKLDDFDKLDELLEELKFFKPCLYKSNKETFVNKMREFIDNN